MVGLVIVSHSATLAAGVVELARQMGSDELRIEAAGGMAEPEGAIGTDPVLVAQAIERAANPDGVLVLMDLGSAVMSAEMAAEMAPGDTEIVLCEAPLVEGAVAAAARAGAGAPLAEVAQEARAAIAMKAAQLGVEPAPAGGSDAAPAGPAPDHELRLPMGNRLGMHARPAARIVETASRFDARITATDVTTGRGPVDARSLSGLVTLGARQGHELAFGASGADAEAALAALQELADDGFGDGLDPSFAAGDAAAPQPGASTDDGGRPAAPSPSAPLEPPAAGSLVRGLPVSPGIALGAAHVSAGREVTLDEQPAGEPAQEHQRVETAIAAAREELQAARERIADRGHAAEAAIFDAHRSLLDDPSLIADVGRRIDDGVAAPAAWHAAVESVADAFRGLDDRLLRERAADVEDVGGRVLRHLQGEGQGAGPLEQAGILVAPDLAPGDAAALDPALVEGIALARGGATSHAAILVRALGIPAVAGLGDEVLAIEPGTTLALDGDAGTLEVAPADELLAERRRAREALAARRSAARSRAAEPATTGDGVTIEVFANAGTVDDARAAVEQGADGIGLLRTEFLFLDRDEAPSEDEQRAVYAEIARALDGRPLTIRTLDGGADKPLRFLAQEPEDNPFLGVRGIRLSLRFPELFAAQLRAIVAVAAEHPVRLMFPMVATPAELNAARAMVEDARQATGAPPLPVGAMVEVPSVPLAAERFARDADFFSVGTNDLTQYTLAAERGNPGVAALMAGTPPPVLRLIAMLTEGAGQHDRPVGVCGELAGDPAAAVLLAGLGVKSLSASAPRVPEVKQALRDVSLADARQCARRALDAEDAAAVAALVAPLVDPTGMVPRSWKRQP